MKTNDEDEVAMACYRRTWNRSGLCCQWKSLGRFVHMKFGGALGYESYLYRTRSIIDLDRQKSSRTPGVNE